MRPADKQLKQQWQHDGYAVIPAFLTQAAIERLRAICNLVLLSVRSKHTSGYGHDTPNIAGLTETDLFGDEMGALIDLLNFIASRAVLDLVQCLGNGPLLFHNTQYFHEQSHRDWNGIWHRDTQFDARDENEERQRMQKYTGIHFRVAFEPDDRLEIVPGSHNRWDTEEELAIRKGADPSSHNMPNAKPIVLRPGDACVFDAWSIHRGTYRRQPLRRTLDIIYGFGGPVDFSIPSPMCFTDPRVMNAVPKTTRVFFDRFVEAYAPSWTASK